MARSPLSRRRVLGLVLYGGGAAALGCAYVHRRSIPRFLTTGEWRPPRTVAQVLDRYGDRAVERYRPACQDVGIPWPPPHLRLLGFKAEGQLEVWASADDVRYRRIATHPIVRLSGGPGPKRRQGDRQVPEGLYALTDLNPNSRFHLSVRIDYPNEEDRRHATVPVPELGGDIFIHGGAASIGCLAMGDDAIEEIFTLVARVPRGRRSIVLSPVDFRAPGVRVPRTDDPRVRELYERIRAELERFEDP